MPRSQLPRENTKVPMVTVSPSVLFRAELHRHVKLPLLDPAEVTRLDAI